MTSAKGNFLLFHYKSNKKYNPLIKEYKNEETINHRLSCFEL